MTDREIQHVTESIASVVSRFKSSPNIFLTEDDLRVHLCSELLQHFGRKEFTADGDCSISLHAEVRWYGNGNLKTRSDVVLVDVSNLEVLNYNNLPSKGYGFNIPKAVIELKLRRPKGESNSAFMKKIECDCKKLGELLSPGV
jgi:hypothetical protein